MMICFTNLDGRDIIKGRMMIRPYEPPIIFKNSSSLIIGTPSFWAFSFLLGPISSPSMMKSRFLETEEIYCPPCAMTVSLISSRLKCTNFPLAKILLPSSEFPSLTDSLSPTSKFNPKPFRRMMISWFFACAKKS